MSSSTSTSERRRLAAGLGGALVVVILALALGEALLRLLPVVSGVHRAAPAGPASSARLEPSHAITHSLSWDLKHAVHLRTNAQGFVSPFDYDPTRPAVAVIGDSFVEALMLPFEESLVGRLHAMLAPAGVVAHNLGVSGAGLPHYLGMAREWRARQALHAMVLVVTPDDYTDGLRQDEGLYGWAEAGADDLIRLQPARARGAWVRFVRELAIVRYLVKNLEFNPRRWLASATPSAMPASACPGTLPAQDRDRIDRFIAALAPQAGLDPSRVTIVFDADRTAIYQRVDGRPIVTKATRCDSLDQLALARLAARARALGHPVVELAPLFEAHYRGSRRPLDFSPDDRHWNGAATAIVAEAVRSSWLEASTRPRD